MAITGTIEAMQSSNTQHTRSMATIVVVVFIVWLILDQVSKFWVVHHFENGGVVDWNLVLIHLVWNPGAAFSLPMPTPVIQGGVALLAAYLIVRAIPKTTSTIMGVCYGAILGGALGNLIDRFVHDGKVVDFIDLNFWPLTTFPVFNIADIGISVGTAIVIVGIAIYDYRQRPQEAPRPMRETVSEETDRGIGG